MNNIAKSLLVIGIVAVMAGAAVTAAYYTTQVNSDGNSVATGNLTITLNSGSTGPALVASNMYPGAFAQSAGVINNTGSIRVNPSISLANASNPDGLASKLWLQIWTNGKLWYNDWITNAPGYTSSKVTLDSINPGASVNVAFRLILDESATATGSYGVDVRVTGYQWNDPAGATTTPTDVDSGYVASTWSYNVCGTRPSSPYYSYDENVWYVQVKPYAATGTNNDATGSCTVPF